MDYRPPTDFVRQLLRRGFVILPCAVSAGRLAVISMAYDELMISGFAPDLKVGSTTTRLYFANNRVAFEDVYQYPPLLEACAHLIGQPYKLSSLLGRTLRAGSPGQDLHIDLSRDCADAPMAGFIFMLDPFKRENGATCFVPGSQDWADVPSDRLADPRSQFEREVLACGEAGSMIIFNAAVWHGHTANSTSSARRSIQGYFVRRGPEPGLNFSS